MKLLWQALLLMTLLLSVSARAASLQVTPVNLFFYKGEKVKGVSLSNTGDKLLRAQLRLYRWQQQEGKDVLTDATELVASPPLAQIPAEKTQLVRMLLVQPASAGEEKSWRLVVDELPSADKERPHGEVDFLLRYSIPVFAGDERLPDISKIHCRLSDGRLWVENHDSQHIKLSNVRLLTGGAEHNITDGLLGYVLPGATMSWPVTGHVTNAQSVRLSLNDSLQTQTLPLAAP